MAFLGTDYAAQESTYEPIPPGEYSMHITSSSMEATKDGRGRYLKLELEIVDGPQSGRKLFERLNLENQNAQAVEIAQRTLKAIVFASGLTSCNDSEQLHMRRMIVRVNVKERKDQPGTMHNEIGGYKAASGGGAQAAASSATAGQGAGSAPATANSAPPWKRAS